MAKADALSEDQAAVYDRQLRVWGVEVQRKLTAASVLVVGLGKLAAEIAKNVVLAGVGNVALLDDRPASGFMGDSFLVSAATPGDASIADAAAGTLQAMNPLVNVKALAGAPDDGALTVEALQGYDLVVATAQPLGTLQRLSAACREAGTGFMAAAAQGFSSFLFVDLGRHEFRPKAAPDAKEQPTEQTLQYASLAEALAAPLEQWSAGVHPLYAALAGCAIFEAERRRPAAAGDVDTVVQMLQQGGQAAGVAVPAALAPVLADWLGGGAEFAPVCAIVGGVAANNVVKAVSHSGAPLRNLFYFSLFDGRGVVEQHPAEVQPSNGQAEPPVETVDLDLDD